MYDYALIIHPTNEELLHRYEPGMRNKPRPLVRKVLEWMSPFRAAEIEGLNSHLGRTAKGTLVMCPLLLEQMVTLSPTKVMRAVLDTIMFAQNVVQPKLIGLTAYASFSGNKGEDLTKILNTPLTTGASYTMAMIPETILRAVDLMETDLSNSSVLILGATSSIGKYCIEILHHFVKEVFITAHNQDKLNLLLSELPKEKKEKLKYCREVGSILDKTNIIIIATNRLPIGLDFSKVVSGAIIFDASYPRKIPNDARDDVLVIDGVAIRPPGKVNFNFDFGLPPGLCYPCIAEAMILALERKYVNYSVGRDANAIRIREILRWGARHGFEIASLTSREKVITNEDIIKIKHNSLKNRKKKFLLWG